MDKATKEFIEEHYSPKRDWVENGSGWNFPKRHRQYSVGLPVPKGFRGIKLVQMFETKLKELLIKFGCDLIEIEDFND